MGQYNKVLFVCTGNTCRSSMAEGIFRALVQQRQHMSTLLAISRGIFAYDGDPASEHSVRALKNLWNIDISNHRARTIIERDVNEADLILTMTRQHRETLKTKYSIKAADIYTLKEYTYPGPDTDNSDLDISDPYGMPYQKYEGCAREIYYCVNELLNKLSL